MQLHGKTLIKISVWVVKAVCWLSVVDTAISDHITRMLADFYTLTNAFFQWGWSHNCQRPTFSIPHETVNMSQRIITNFPMWKMVKNISWACPFYTKYFVLPYSTNCSQEDVHLLSLNTLRPRQNGRHFADDIFKCIFLNENVWIPIKISLKFVPKGPINNIPALVQIMAWRRPGDKPLSGPMMVSLTTHICVTKPQWVLTFNIYKWLNTNYTVDTVVSLIPGPSFTGRN